MHRLVSSRVSSQFSVYSVCKSVLVTETRSPCFPRSSDGKGSPANGGVNGNDGIVDRDGFAIEHPLASAVKDI